MRQPCLLHHSVLFGPRKNNLPCCRTLVPPAGRAFGALATENVCCLIRVVTCDADRAQETLLIAMQAHHRYCHRPAPIKRWHPATRAAPSETTAATKMNSSVGHILQDTADISADTEAVGPIQTQHSQSDNQVHTRQELALPPRLYTSVVQILGAARLITDRTV